MKQKLRKILPHVAIVLCNMYIVFFLIDRVNTAMQFIDNSITKALLLILSIISTVNASFLIQEERKREAARNRRQSASGGRSGSGAREPQSAQVRTARTAAGTQGVRTAAARPSAASGQRQPARTARR